MLKPRNREIFSIVVNYDRSIKEGISVGYYSYSNTDITQEHFPADDDERGLKQRQFVLYHFNKKVDTTFAATEMEKDDYVPATVRELLVFAETYPDFQNRFLILALSSVWERQPNEHCIAFVGRMQKGRYLSLRREGRKGWHRSFRFLAVKK